MRRARPSRSRPNSRKSARALLAALRERRPIEEPVALVVAHPDDETLALGGSLHLFRRLLLIHVTDGAPLSLGDAAREGFTSPAAYAAARAAELDAALALVASGGPTRMTLGISDQLATAAIPDITVRLHQAFTAHHVRTVLTHCYEGGHPDHDAVASAVQRTGAEIFEFAGYHADRNGALQTGEFLTHPSHIAGYDPPLTTSPEATVIHLHGDDLVRKQAMLACFRTQREILRHFDPRFERFRRAPRYDFAQPPHPGRLLYEAWGWMSGQEWREQARCGA